MDDRSLLGLLPSQGRLDEERLVVIAELFKVEGDIHAAQNRSSEGDDSYSRALAGYLEAALADQSSPDGELIGRAEALNQQVSGNELPAETLSRLRDFYSLRMVFLNER